MFKGVIDAIDTIDAYFLFSGKNPPDSAGIRIFDNFFFFSFFFRVGVC